MASIVSSNTNGASASYTYDDLNRLSTVVDSRLGTTTYTYDNANNVFTVAYPNTVTTTYGYDQLNRVSGLGYPMPREPRPIDLESRSVPSHNSLWLDKYQCPLPFRPELPQHQPEQSVSGSKPRLRTPSFQNGQLVPKRQVFHEQLAAGTEESDN